MEIEKTRQIIKSCRYCLMCKHVCPSGSYSYFESDYPRGRALIMDRVLEGKNDYTKDMIDALYNCFLCDSCHASCEGDWELPQAVRQARYDIVARDLEPQRAKEIKESLQNTGHPFVGETLDPVRISSQKECDLLYVMGPYIRFKQHDIAKAAKSIIEASGDCFSVLEDEPDCGAVLDMLGYRKEAENKGRALFNKIGHRKPKRILVSDPLLYYCISSLFKDWGLDTGKDMAIEHISGYVLRNLKAGRLDLKKFDERVTLVDSEYLCRFCDYCLEPREVLKEVCGNNFVEMRHRKKQMIATGEAAFFFNGGKVEGSLLGKRIAQEAEAVRAGTAVTLSGTAKENLSSSFSGKVLEFGEFIRELIQ